MSGRTPRTRRGLVAALMSSPDRRTADALVRRARSLAGVETARLLDERFSRLIRESPTRAATAAHGGAAVAAVARDPLSRAFAHRMAGVLAHVRGRSGAAPRRLLRAADLFAEAGDLVRAGDAHRIRMEALSYLGRFAEAGRAAARARASYRRAGGIDPRRLGSLAMNVGNIHHRRDAHAAALDAYDEARRHYRRAGEGVRVANAEYNRANILATLDRTVEARRLYGRARKTYRDAGLGGLVAHADFALAGLDLLEGRLDECLSRLSAPRERFERTGDWPGTAHADMEAAAAYLRLNRPREARRAARRADTAFRRAGHLAERAHCAGLLGGALMQMGRPAEARRHFRRGRELHRRGGNPVAAALLEVGLAETERRAGRPGVAIDIARRAAAVLRRRQLASREARALAVGADAAVAAGRTRLARSWAERAALLSRRRRDARVLMAALLVLARLDTLAGHGERAHRRLLQAERCVERLRRGISTEESRLAFGLDKIEVYEALVANRLARGDEGAVRQALVYAERGKARALAEKLSQSTARALPGARRLLRRLDDVERQLALAEARLEQGERTPGIRHVSARRLDALSRERVEALRRLSRHDPGQAVFRGGVPPDPWETVSSLAPGEVVLEYTQSDGDLHLFLVDRESVRAFPRIAARDDVRDLVDRLHFQLGKGALGEAHLGRFDGFVTHAATTYLQRLHDLLLAPVASELVDRRVRIVPHGLLHGVPFHALESEGVALIDRSVVSYAPSLAVMSLLDRAARHGDPPGTPLVMGVSDAAAPAIDDEVRAVRRHLGRARVLVGPEATRSALRDTASRPALLHVACHGFFSEGGPLTGALLLGDAWLSHHELSAIGRAAECVVLSGCKTGRGTVYSGDEWVGLVGGFLQAGARTVVASLWEVHDRTTVALMDEFYGNLTTGLPAAAALAEAQRSARRRDPSPLRWAPFIVLGDPTFALTRSSLEAA